MAAGLGNKFAIGQKPFSGGRNFELNKFTTSKERYEMTMDIFDNYPQTRLGGVTNRWLNEVMVGTRRIRPHYGNIRISLRVAHAGIENYSESSEMIKLCEEAPYCNHLYLETSKHEVLMDRDINRDIVLTEIEKFFR
jgi:lysophospholipase